MSSVLTVQVITELARDTWTSLLADEHGLLPRHPGGDSASGSDEAPGSDEAIAATVHISGEWNGTACLSCSTAAGRRAAAVMFEMEDEDLTAAEVSDAVGELINVVGGNIKGLLPNPTTLSLPAVHHGADFELPGHLELALEVRFTWIDEPVMFTVWTAG